MKAFFEKQIDFTFHQKACSLSPLEQIQHQHKLDLKTILKMGNMDLHHLDYLEIKQLTD